MKVIQKIINSEKVNMGGIILDQPLPQGGVSHVDPYLLIHHWEETLPGNQHQRDVGVGPHPHRGFSPITFIYSGAVHHKDSQGNDSIVKAGGTQWMFAGKGITHSERPPSDLADKGGHFEFIQIWLNAPAAHKMDTPKYMPLSSEDTPIYKSVDGLVEVGVVAGSLYDINGAIEHKSDVDIFRLTLKKDGKIELPIKDSYQTCFYLLDGEIVLDDEKIIDRQLVIIHKNLGDISIKANKNSRILFLSGKPIGEKIAQYGPFVMNSQSEVMQAMRDAQMGKMGVLIE